MSNSLPGGISRRTVLKGAGLGATALGATALLSACGGIKSFDARGIQ